MALARRAQQCLEEGIRYSQWERALEESLSALIRQQNWGVHCYRELGSTMDCARQIVTDAAPRDPQLVLTERQTAGRGRQGRAWHESPRSFMGTLVVPHHGSLAGFTGFSLVIGCLVRRIIQHMGVEVLLKWPNDVVTPDGKKLAGVLIELVGGSTGATALVGVGVNVGAPPATVPHAVGLREFGQEVHPVTFASMFLEQCGLEFDTFFSEGFAAFRSEWMSVAYGLDSVLQVDTGTTVVRGVCNGVDHNGALLLENEQGIHTIVSGHVVAGYEQGRGA